jgi:hypothetical protein
MDHNERSVDKAALEISEMHLEISVVDLYGEARVKKMTLRVLDQCAAAGLAIGHKQARKQAVRLLSSAQ